MGQRKELASCIKCGTPLNSYTRKARNHHCGSHYTEAVREGYYLDYARQKQTAILYRLRKLAKADPNSGLDRK